MEQMYLIHSFIHLVHTLVPELRTQFNCLILILFFSLVSKEEERDYLSRNSQALLIEHN